MHFQGIERQFAALQKGFTEVVNQDFLAPFDERELELIIGGLGKIDVEDWKANTRLKVSPLGRIDVENWKANTRLKASPLD